MQRLWQSCAWRRVAAMSAALLGTALLLVAITALGRVARAQTVHTGPHHPSHTATHPAPLHQIHQAPHHASHWLWAPPRVDSAAVSVRAAHRAAVTGMRAGARHDATRARSARGFVVGRVGSMPLVFAPAPPVCVSRTRAGGCGAHGAP